MTLTSLIVLLVAYLLGSISSAVMVCRIFGTTDPRDVGSHNPGATNVLRTAGKKAAAWTLIGDMAKGLIAVGVAQWLGLSPFWQSLTVLAALVGHSFPIYFKFKGGKGVATVFGGLLALHWAIGVTILAVWLAVFSLTRTSSIAAIVAALTVPLSSFYVLPEAMLPINVIALWVLLRHYENITNLLGGKEKNFKK